MAVADSGSITCHPCVSQEKVVSNGLFEMMIGADLVGVGKPFRKKGSYHVGRFEAVGGSHGKKDSLDEEVLESGSVCSAWGDTAHHPWKEKG
jgi:hypothetical protein